MITYSTAEGATPAFSRAALMAMAPRSLPEKSFSEPMSLPTGVRAPATITDVVIRFLQRRLTRHSNGNCVAYHTSANIRVKVTVTT
jgi:hypothetical protein